MTPPARRICILLCHTERKSWVDLKSTSSTSHFPLRLWQSYCIMAVGYSTDRGLIISPHTFSHQEQEPADENSQKNVLRRLGVRFLLCISTLLFFNFPLTGCSSSQRQCLEFPSLTACLTKSNASESQHVAYSFPLSSVWCACMLWLKGACVAHPSSLSKWTRLSLTFADDFEAMGSNFKKGDGWGKRERAQLAKCVLAL